MEELRDPVIYRDGLMSAPPITLEVSDEKYTTDEETKLSSPEINESVESIPYNVRALCKNESTYKLETFEKNYLVIFNQKNIIGYDSPRLGTEKDADALEKTFSKYGFEVHRHTDLTKREVFMELKKFKTKDFTDYGCVAVAVLTHGTYGGLIRAKDQLYSETEIINYFKTHDKPTLITKPKLLIIQACRGNDLTRGVFANQAGKIYKDVDDDQGAYSLPIEADMLVFHSSYIGKPSHRVDLYGSWFIQSLCREIDRLSPKVDIESIMIEVKKAVAIDLEHVEFNRATGDIDINKQMPVMYSSLIRKLYLKKYEGTTSESFFDGKVSASYESVSDWAEPKTPSSAQTCLCFLPHFEYLKQCLIHFVEENPDDRIAQSYLEICQTFEDIAEFNMAKERMAKVISEHLKKKISDINLIKYLYLYNHD